MKWGNIMIVKPAGRLEHIKEYYFSTKLKELARLNTNGKQIINLGIGKPDLPAPKTAIETLNASARNKNNHGYQSYVGLPELRKAFSSWYRKYYGVELNPDQEILPLIGSKEGIMHISMSFLEPGDLVLVPNPGYPAYTAAARISGAEIRHYNLTEKGNWYPDLNEIEKEDLSRVKIMWVNYPHMPTGTKGNQNIFQELVEFAKANQILLCHDNPYSFVLNENPQSIFSVPGAMECALELNSLSKSHNMSGWRVGMLGGSAEYIQTVLKFKSNMDSGMFKAVQEGAVEALKLDQNWYTELNTIYADRKEAVHQIYDHLGCRYAKDQSGMFVWARIPEQYTDAIELTDEILYQANVFITPGNIFGSNGNAYVRISLCQPKEVIEQALERIIALWTIKSGVNFKLKEVE